MLANKVDISQIVIFLYKNTITFLYYYPVAQLAERQIVNLRVLGSSPNGIAKIKNIIIIYNSLKYITLCIFKLICGESGKYFALDRVMPF